MNAQAVGGLLARHALTALAGYLAGKGISLDDQSIEALTTALVGIGGVLWSVWQKERQKKEVDAALNTMPPGEFAPAAFSNSVVPKQPPSTQPNGGIQAPVEVRGVQGAPINPPPGACE